MALIGQRPHPKETKRVCYFEALRQAHFSFRSVPAVFPQSRHKFKTAISRRKIFNFVCQRKDTGDHHEKNCHSRLPDTP